MTWLIVNETEKWAAEDEMVRQHHQIMVIHLSKLWEIVEDREASVLPSTGPQRVRRELVTEQQQLMYNVVLVSGTQQSDSVIHAHALTHSFFSFFSSTGHDRRLSRDLCAVH